MEQKNKIDIKSMMLEELQEYLFEKCGYFHQKKEKMRLKYQIEYLLYGKNSDLKNLEEVLEDILHIREVINITYLFFFLTYFTL